MPLEDIFRVLKEYGGYYVVRDGEGDQFVITELGEKDRDEERVEEKPDEADDNEAEELLEKINRDIAMYRSQEDDLGVEANRAFSHFAR